MLTQTSNRAAWTAFLLTCFAITGLTGLFASYATSLPLERALRLGAALDRALTTGQAAELEALRPALGRSADQVISGPGDLASRVGAARAAMLSEQDREAHSVAHRVRIMLGVVTFMAGGLGAGILALAMKGARG